MFSKSVSDVSWPTVVLFKPYMLSLRNTNAGDLYVNKMSKGFRISERLGISESCA